MARDTPLGFPAHTLPYRCGGFTTLLTVSTTPSIRMVLFSYLFCCLRLPAGFPALNGPQQSFALPQAQQSEYRRRNA